jgi:tetratricopeptide (TPR) repeat protein
MQALEQMVRWVPFIGTARAVQQRCSALALRLARLAPLRALARLALLRVLALVGSLAFAALPGAALGVDTVPTGTALRASADRVLAAFAELVDPPVTELAFDKIDEHEAGAPLRAHVRRRHAQAVEALLVLASTPQGSLRVAKVLRQLDVKGRSVEAEEWLIERADTDTRALRDLVALADLPAALAARLSPGDGGLRFGGHLGRDNRPLGRLAEAELRRIVAADPADAEAWLELAWVAEASSPDRGEAEAQRAVAAARSAGSPLLEVLALQQLARLRQSQGRGADALAAAEAAWRVARDAASRPGSGIGDRERAQALGRLADAQAATGATTEARQTLRQALALRQALVQARPDDIPLAIEWVGTLQRLGRLERAAGAVPPGVGPDGDLELRAWLAYQELEARTPYRSPFARRVWPGMVASALLQAGVITLLGGLLLLALYRWRIGRWMMAAAAPRVGAATVATAAPTAPASVVDAAAGTAAGPIRPPLIASAATALRQAVAVQVVAGVAFGVLAAWLQLRAAEIEIHFNRFAVVSLSHAFPTTLVVCLLWAGDRKRQAAVFAVYVGVLGLVCLRIASGSTPPMVLFGVTVPALFQGLVFWALSVGLSPFLLLFLNRRIRAVGPPLLLLMGVASVGSLLVQVLAFLPASRHGVVRVLSALMLPEALWIPAIILVGMLVFLPLAWAALALLRAVHNAKWINDQTMVIDSIWLFQALLLSSSLISDIGLAGWVGLSAFALYKAITVVGMLPLALAARRRTPSRLLLLRVFRRQRSSERLFDLLAARWRHAGPIRMIGAPDLAASTIDPDEFLDFLAGRLRRRFILEAGDLQARLARMDDRPDIDGRFRVTDLFCGNDVWQAAVRALMARSDGVAMDLRGFSAQNQGCVFELQALVDSVPCRRIALLVDHSTDQALLRDTLQACLSRTGVGSPNRSGAGRGSITVLDAGAGELAAVQHLLRLARTWAPAASGTASGTPARG